MFRKLICTVICIITIANYSCYIVFADNLDTEDINVEEIIQTSSQNVDNSLEIASKIAVAYDRASGRVIWGKDENKRTAMASTTKIMTAIVTLENCKLDEIVKVSSKAAWTGGSELGLKTDDEISVNDLLYGLMLRSGNDAAVAIAEHVGGSVEGFANLMNNKAKELGLVDTHFVTPHGLDDPEHYTTAKELAIIADYAMKNNKFKQIVGTKQCVIHINKNQKEIANTNELLGVLNGVNGVKTGFTNNAGRCLVTSINRNGWEIIVVVLRADTKKIRTKDSVKIIEYIYKNYEPINIENVVKEKFEEWCKINLGHIIINKAASFKLQLELSELKNKIIPVKKTEVDNIEIEINSLLFFEAPVEKQTVFGNLKIINKNDVIEIVEVKNKDLIKRKNIKNYFVEFFQNL